MLQSFRDNLKGTVATILVGLICIPFVLFGVDSLFTSNPSTQPVAVVNGEEITQIELDRAILVQRRQLMAQFGENLPADMFSDERLREPVLKSLVEQALLKQAAMDNGMGVSNSALDEIILQSGQFNVEGKFDQNIFLQSLRNMGYTPASYKKLLAEEVVLGQFSNGISASGFVTALEEKMVTELSKQKRDFEYVMLTKDKVEASIEVDESEIQGYYGENQSQFVREESVVIEAVELSTEAIAQSIEIDDEQIREQYEQEVEVFEQSTRRRVAHILVEADSENAEQRITEIQQKLADGEAFEEVAKSLSDDFGSKDNGGDLGYTTGDAFADEFEAQVASMAEGEVSDPVETEFGTHIIKVLEVEETTPPTFEEARLRIAQDLKNSEAEERFIQDLERLKELSYNAESLDEVAKSLGVELWVSERFDRKGGVGLARNPAVVEVAFSEDVLANGYTSDVVELDERTAVVVRVKEHFPEAVKPLEEVSDEILTKLKADKSLEKLNSEAQTLIAELQKGASVSDLAKEKELEFKESKDTTRQTPGLAIGLVSKVFSLPKPLNDEAVIESLELSNGDVAIVKLASVSMGSSEDMSPQELRSVQAQLKQSASREDMSNMEALLNSLADIE
ncbi:SurA N-terminal domain-containing protein [Marinibactrum halimedae]|uniref:Periplasmic chaperone PpiD n=1 Tax=Marinibactrum halimedae TaxID=1444977 RepID=A0AA37TAM9_9GAMM|nr:SurA N-terminal domain-containing protein [Marinibactrum halimedae]MCD9459869.1 SurA N-terminal domain-containing protein [Marinibactrum halimedae]GLS26936.1 peptidylprolyl isomerase [Marinibactrum halimedae]